MRLERFDKSAHIPVRVRNGQVEFLYDVELPSLEDGAIGELVVDVRAVLDPKWREFLVAEMSVEVAPKEALVVFKMAVDKGALDNEKQLISFQESLDLMKATVERKEDAEGLAAFGDGVGVLGRLTEPLFLRLRGENLSQLRGGAVFIPALAELKLPGQAPTLNQALILVSQTFEPKRAGHTGDAFRDIYLLEDRKWVLLDAIRGRHEAQHENNRWDMMGLDPQKVRARIQNKGGLFPDESTKKPNKK